MHILRIPLSAIQEQGITLDVVVPIEELRPEGADKLPTDSVAVKGYVSSILPTGAPAREYVFHGTIRGVFQQPCDRCLEVAAVEFCTDVLWTFREGSSGLQDYNEVEEEPSEPATMRPTAGGIEGNELNLTACVWEETSLAMPAKFLCSENCVGLCPQCGVNRNREQCACLNPAEEKISNKGLAGLADLFPDLRSKKPED